MAKRFFWERGRDAVVGEWSHKTGEGRRRILFLFSILAIASKEEKNVAKQRDGGSKVKSNLSIASLGE